MMDTMGDELEGDVLGEQLAVVGAARRHGVLHLPPRPGWHRQRVSAGVWGPREFQENLTFKPDVGVIAGNVAQFTSVGPAQIEFTARPQHPFRSERFLVSVKHTNPNDGIILMSQGMFIGTDLQQANRGGFDIEVFGPQAFGVRFASTPAEPGVDISIVVFLSSPLTAPDKVTVSMQYIGKGIR